MKFCLSWVLPACTWCFEWQRSSYNACTILSPFFLQECARTPGFISMMRSSGAGNEKQYLDYENYRHITFKWHFKLTKSLVVLLESKDYMQVHVHVDVYITRMGSYDELVGLTNSLLLEVFSSFSPLSPSLPCFLSPLPIPTPSLFPSLSFFSLLPQPPSFLISSFSTFLCFSLFPVSFYRYVMD